MRLSRRELEELAYWFQEFDRDGSGKISRHELKDGFYFCFGQNYSNWQIDEMIWETDENGDGKINFEEFVNLMTGVDYTSSSSSSSSSS